MTPKQPMGCYVTRSCLRIPRVQPPICSPSTTKPEASLQWQQAWTERYLTLFFPWCLFNLLKYCYYLTLTVKIVFKKVDLIGILHLHLSDTFISKAIHYIPCSSSSYSGDISVHLRFMFRFLFKGMPKLLKHISRLSES